MAGKKPGITEILSPEAFTEVLRVHGMDVPVQGSMAELGKPLGVEGKTIPNRICFQPLEGYDSRPDGAPSELVYRRYRRFAGSGAGLVCFESAAVADDGKSNPNQMKLSPGRISDFGKLLEEMDRISLEQSGFRQYKVLQLTHSCRVSRGTDWKPKPLAARLLETDTDDSVLASDDRIFAWSRRQSATPFWRRKPGSTRLISMRATGISWSSCFPPLNGRGNSAEALKTGQCRRWISWTAAGTGQAAA